jgi:hypothetical protein
MEAHVLQKMTLGKKAAGCIALHTGRTNLTKVSSESSKPTHNNTVHDSNAASSEDVLVGSREPHLDFS